MNGRMCLIVAALVGLSCGLGGAQEPGKPAVSNAGDLRGKIVAITLMSDVEDLVLLSDIREKHFGGKAFLCGNGVDDGETPDWRNGADVHIPVDDIQQLVAFTDLNAYKKNLEARQHRVEGKAASLRTRRGARS